MAEQEHQNYVALQPDIVPSNSAGSSSYLTSKRQRRPSVRLGDIGDPPLAMVTMDTYLKRRNAAPYNSHTKVPKLATARPFQDAIDDSHNRHFLTCTQDVPHYDPMSSSHPIENRLSTDRVSYSKLYNPKNRNGKQGRKGPRILLPLNKLARVVPPVIDIDGNQNEKTLGPDESRDPFAGEEWNDTKPQNLRNCDVQTSEGLREVKEDESLQTKKHPQDRQQPSFRGMHTLNSRNEGNGGEFRHGTVSNHIVSMDLGARELPDSIHDVQLDSVANSLSEMKAGLMPEANGSMIDKVAQNSKGNKQLEVPDTNQGCGGVLLDEVKEWLHHLGLVKYAPVFAAHEVDADVLALLTLDDLKEMGIFAVGARRKMFSAIQKIGRSQSTHADTL